MSITLDKYIRQNAMQRVGFKIQKTDESTNPLYLVSYSQSVNPVKVFSALLW
ncbi:MAG: hypothetical protein U9R60_07840 [Bacteroidota bacterium]|nr:hypothetical protein [Bacteroidota bacterium]